MIGVIGAGNVGQALLWRWLQTNHPTTESKSSEEPCFIFSTKRQHTGEALLKEFKDAGHSSNIQFTTDNAELIQKASMIVLA